MSEANFSLGSNFEVKNSAVNEYFCDKTLLTDQEVGTFVKEQRNPRTVEELIVVIASLSMSFRSRLVQVFFSVLVLKTQSKFGNPLTTLTF